MEQLYERHRLEWQGRKIEIRYQPQSFAGYAHLQISSRNARPLPISETGYRSHFTSSLDVAEMGGPAAYVEMWLNNAARTKSWRSIASNGLQLNLL